MAVSQSSDQILLNQVESVYSQFMYLPNEHASTVCSLWVAASHLRLNSGIPAPYHYGRLYFGSKLAGCGKSLALELTELMAYNGKHVSEVTPPALQAYMTNQCTLCFDEVDLYFGRGTSKASARTILNDGYRRGATTANVRGDDLVEYGIAGWIAMAGKNLTRMMTSEAFSTLKTRSFIIALEQKPPGHPVERFRHDIHAPRLHGLRRQLTRWGQTNALRVVDIDVDATMPAEIDNRDRDIWTVLYQIAAFVGGDWPSRVDNAARALVLGQWGEEETPTVSPAEDLLCSVRAVFNEGETFLPSVEIIDRLMDLPTQHWWHMEWTHTTTRSRSMALSTQLKVFGIAPGLGTYEGDQERGYVRAQLDHMVESMYTT